MLDTDGTVRPLLRHSKGLRNGRYCFLVRLSRWRQVALALHAEYQNERPNNLNQNSSRVPSPEKAGQLPGRRSAPTIAYVAPDKTGSDTDFAAPHHDIYSIEDLAQLIFDLAQINPKARYR
jgi:hypothetical protein